MMKNPNWKVGVFVFASVVLFSILIFTIGKPGGFFSSRLSIGAKFNKIEGLTQGSAIRLSGIQIGTVKNIEFGEKIGEVLVWFNVDKSYGARIKVDSKAEVQTLGLLGDKYISIGNGTPNARPIKEGEVLESQENVDISKFAPSVEGVLNNVYAITDELKIIMKNLNESNALTSSVKSLGEGASEFGKLAKSLNQKTEKLDDSLNKLSIILGKVEKGEGTIGALINDPTVYEQLKSILGGVERNKILKYMIRQNIQNTEEKK